jgi:hypothetical protein
MVHKHQCSLVLSAHRQQVQTRSILKSSLQDLDEVGSHGLASHRFESVKEDLVRQIHLKHSPYYKLSDAEINIPTPCYLQFVRN